jgi:hypothetical protein
MTPLLGHGLNSYSTIKNENGGFRVNNLPVHDWKTSLDKGLQPTNYQTGVKFHGMLELVHNFHYSGQVLDVSRQDPRIRQIVNTFLKYGVGKKILIDGKLSYNISDKKSVIYLDLMKRYFTLIAATPLK